jgi:single-stranded DNA-binding protein
MPQSTLDTNRVVVAGKVVSECKLNHELYGESFYEFLIETPRLSDNADVIPIMVSERLIAKDQLVLGSFVSVEGQFRSYNNRNEFNGNKLKLIVFARDICIVEDSEEIKNQNLVIFNGFICKEPVYRTTLLGREICDIIIAVNRAYHKSDYIPIITWGRNARFSQNLKVGDNIKVWGRIQSREYEKKLDDGNVLEKTAYEVSVSKIECVK